MNRILQCLLILPLALLPITASAPAFAQQATIAVEPINGGFDMDFGNVKSLGPDGELKTNIVTGQLRLIITNPSGNPYKIYQTIYSSWQNESGENLPFDSVQFFITNTKTPGLIKVPTNGYLQSGQQEIFQSDPQGDNEDFLINYTIRIPPEQKAGRYRMNVAFNVVTQ
ncbi:MAG: hypothetical protein HZC17_09710 [Candidatus Omnitrophica bacterium]|nr:hypothetical protein [Candidatus Omnitrophota bacterium]